MVVAFVPVETPCPLAAVCCSSCPCIFFRSMTTPPKRNKAPTATTGIYRIPTNDIVQRLTFITNERDAHTQIAGESPVLGLSRSSRFDCLAYSVCHGAARATGGRAARRIIDSMDMIMKERRTNREDPTASVLRTTLGLALASLPHLLKGKSSKLGLFMCPRTSACFIL